MRRSKLMLLAVGCWAGLAYAEPSSLALQGEYRPLLASDKPLLGGSFERDLGQALAAALGSAVQGEQGLLAGGTVDGLPVYESVAGGLTASEDGVSGWTALRGKTFCATQGSPHVDDVASRYGATPRLYPSAAHALNGIKLAECVLVVEDQRLLRDIARLPEWRRYNELLPPLEQSRAQLRIATADAQHQPALDDALAQLRRDGAIEALTQKWVHEVAFQAYVLADTLDCH